MTKNTVDKVIGDYDHLAEGFRKEAASRRSLEPNSPVANTYERCAEDVEKLGAALHEGLDLVTPEVYAELNRITPQTVRRWCRNDEITHFQDERGLLIPRHAKRNRESRLD